MLCSISVIALLAVKNVRYLLITASLPKTQHWTAQSALVRSLIPPAQGCWHGPLVSIGDQCQVYDNLVAEQIDPENLDYMVLTAHGTGTPGLHQPLPEKLQAAINRGDFKMVHSTIDDAPSRMMGIPLSNSAWGAGCIIYKAIPKQ